MSVVEQPTVELKVQTDIITNAVHANSLPTLWQAEMEKRLAKEEAQKELMEMAEKTKSELQELLLASK